MYIKCKNKFCFSKNKSVGAFFIKFNSNEDPGLKKSLFYFLDSYHFLVKASRRYTNIHNHINKRGNKNLYTELCFLGPWNWLLD